MPLPCTPTVIVNQHLSHLTSLNDHRPSRHTGTSNEFHTCQNINNTDNTTPSTRPTGINKKAIGKHSTSSLDTTADKTEHDSQCDALSHPRTASDPLMLKASSQPGMTPSSPKPINSTHETPAAPQCPVPQALLTQAMAHQHPTNRVWQQHRVDLVYQAVVPVILINYNERALRKLHGRPLAYCMSWRNSTTTALPRKFTYPKDHKPFVVMVRKDVVSLSHQLKCIMLCFHQYSMCILYKPSITSYYPCPPKTLTVQQSPTADDPDITV